MNLLLDSNIIIYLLTPQRHLVERVISAQTAYVS